MKHRIFSFLITFVIINNVLFSQTQNTDLAIINNSSEKFNMRGLGDPNFVPDGKETINDYDGNVLLSYSSTIKLPNSLGGDFTIIYNTNVEHHFWPMSASSDICINSPEWILGYKGFALQALNFQNERLTHNENYVLNGPPFTGERVPMTIPGYHKSDIVFADNNVPDRHNVIGILMADGSIKKLKNIDVKTGIGIYLDEDIEEKGFAFVDYKNVSSGLRLIRYKPGDGLTYIFEEDFINWRDIPTQNLESCIYLMEIDSPNGQCVKFTYDYHDNTSHYGRKLLTGIKADLIPGQNLSVCQINYQYTSTNGQFIIDIIDNLTSEYKFSIETNKVSNLFDDYRVADLNRILSIKNLLTSNLMKKDGFTYDINSSAREYSGGEVPSNYAPFAIENMCGLLTGINYYNGKRVNFSYWDRSFKSPLTSIVDLTFHNFYDTENMKKASRDCFTNYMLKSVSYFDAASLIPVYQKDYDYSLIGAGLGEYDLYNTNLLTTITTTDNTPLAAGLAVSEQEKTSKQEKVEKYYMIYRTSPKDIYQNDYSSTIKQYEERTIDLQNINNIERMIYGYDIGTEINSGINGYFNGSFLCTSQTREIHADQKPTITIPEKRIDYEKEDITFQAIKLSMTKELIKGIKTYDPLNMCKSIQYLNNIPNNNVQYSQNLYTFTMPFWDYHLGLLEEEMEYPQNDPSQNKNHNKYEYYSQALDDGKADNNLVGKLKTTIKNFGLRQNIINCEYYNNPGLWNSGLIKSIKYKDGNLEERYTYKTLSNNLYTGIVAGLSYYMFSTLNYYKGLQLSYDGFQIEPIQAETYVNNVFHHRTGSFYELNKTLKYSTDENNHITSYQNDHLGRVIKITLPGYFEFTENPPPYTEYGPYTFEYDDINRIFTKKTKQYPELDPQELRSFVTKIYYDVFGNISKKEVGGIPKQSNIYDSNNMCIQTTDGENRTSLFSYDYLSRLIKVTHPDNTFNSTSYDYVKCISSTDIVNNENPSDTLNGIISNNELRPWPTYFRKRVTDENGNINEKYYDFTDKLIKENKYLDNANYLTTNCSYSPLYQLASITTPENKNTFYTYDELGFISSKTTPDEGTINYKYDKYGNLRFELNAGCNNDELGLYFNKYDDFNRLILKGVLQKSYVSWSVLDPDMSGAESIPPLN